MNRFPDNSTVCFVGDSITATYNYVARIAQYYLEHFPNSGVKIFNCGVAGGTARSQRIFLEDDTLCHNPTHAVVMVGVNDSGRWLLAGEKSLERYKALKERYLDYEKNLRQLCDELTGRGIKLTLCTPAPYAEYQKTTEEALPGGYALILAYANLCRSLAREKGYELCDYHDYLTQKLETEELYVADHIHPNDKGHHYMAECFLASQGLEIGEFSPISQSLDEIRKYSIIARNIYAVELMIIGDLNYTKLSDEEKLATVQKYIDEKRATTDYFRSISTQYMTEKKNLKEYSQRVHELTCQLMGRNGGK